MKKPSTPDELIIGGFTALTTIDYPDQLSAVVFLQGCPWRCRYCHNADLLPRQAMRPIPWRHIIAHLERRSGLLDAVVFSGGEATLQTALTPAIEQVKAMGFKVGLHSAGIYPQRLKKILPLIDWIGLDIKASVDEYPVITQTAESGERAWESLQWVLQSGVPYDIRTTVHGALINTAQLDRLSRQLKKSGVKNYSLQPCATRHCLDAQLSATPPGSLDALLMQRLQTDFPVFSIRKN